MRTRTVWIGVALLAAAGIGAVLYSGHQRRQIERERTRKEQEERKARTPRVKTIRIAGEVLDATGMGVKGATVYVLDKKRLGSDRDKIDHEVTDARGQWTLRVRKTVGCWIGVVASGYRTVLLDGDGVDVTKKIIHVVERSPSLTVTVVDGSGAPVPDAGLQLAPWPPGGTYFCPGPLCRQGEQWGVTDPQGRATFRQDVAAPLVITPFIDGFHTHPAPPWMPDARGELRIEVHPNVSLDIELHHAGTPVESDELVTLSFHEPATGQVAFAFAEPLKKPGLVHIDRAVVPGTYRLQVSLPGRPQLLLEDVVVPEQAADGSVARIPVSLGAARANAAGSLTVSLDGNTATTEPRGRRRAPLSFLMRTDGPWAALGWQPGAPEKYDAKHQTLRYALEPGTYRLLIADVLTGRAATERAIVVEAGTAKSLTLAMQLGQFGALPDVREGDVYVRALDARDASGKVLPVFGSSRNGRQRFSRGIDLIARKLRGEDVVVGPYPLDAFDLVLVRSDGGRTRAQYK